VGIIYSNTLIFIPGLLFLTSCSNIKSHSETLYRSSLLSNNSRIHIATFNTKEWVEYNEGNCQITKSLFQNQKNVKTKFWCEKGEYKN